MKTIEIKREVIVKTGNWVSISNITYQIEGFIIPAKRIKAQLNAADWLPLHQLNPMVLYEVKVPLVFNGEGFIREFQSDCEGESSFVFIAPEWKWLLLLENKSLNEFPGFSKLPFTGLSSGPNGLEDYLLKGNKAELINFPLLARGFFAKASPDTSNYLQVDEYSFFTQPPSFIWVDLLDKLFKQIGYHLYADEFVKDEVRNLIIPYSGKQPFRWNMKTIGAATGELNQTGIITNQQSSGLMKFSVGGGAMRAIRYLLPQDDKVNIQVELEVTNTHPLNNVFCQWAFQPMAPVQKTQVPPYSEDFTLEPFETFTQTWETQGAFESFTTLEVLLISTGIVTGFLDFNIKVTFNFPEADTELNLVGQLPDVSVLNLLKRFMQMFNLTAVPDALTHTVWLKPFGNESTDSMALASDLNEGEFNIKDLPVSVHPIMKALRFKDTVTGDYQSLNIPHLHSDNKTQSPQTSAFPLADYWEYDFGFTLLKLKGLALGSAGLFQLKVGDSELPVLLSEFDASELSIEGFRENHKPSFSRMLHGVLNADECY